MVIPYNQSTEYLFIDGGSLRGFLETVAKEFFPGETFEVGLGRLPNTYTKIFYYDAFPVRETGESEEAYNARCAPQQALFSRLRVTNDVHVYEGDARRRRKRGLEQKNGRRHAHRRYANAYVSSKYATSHPPYRRIKISSH